MLGAVVPQEEGGTYGPQAQPEKAWPPDGPAIIVIISIPPAETGEVADGGASATL